MNITPPCVIGVACWRIWEYSGIHSIKGVIGHDENLQNSFRSDFLLLEYNHVTSTLMLRQHSDICEIVFANFWAIPICFEL